MEKKIYLTFDMEWANDDVLDYFYHLVEKLAVKATIMVTHDTKWNDIFRKNPDIELGIHPNFNKLLLGKVVGGGYTDILEDLKRIVPEAEVYRSHSLTVSSPIINKCLDEGIKYDLNMYVRPGTGMKLSPYKRYNMLMIPFIFEDDLWLLDTDKMTIDYYLSDDFDIPRVFNFHPIQLYLNCEKYERYEKAKVHNHEQKALEKYRNAAEYGIENLFMELVHKGKENGYSFGLINDLGRELQR